MPTHSKIPPPPNYFSRSVQIRLFALVCSLMLVLLLMGEVAKEKNWEWMWKLGAPAEDPAVSGQGDAAQATDLHERDDPASLDTRPAASSESDRRQADRQEPTVGAEKAPTLSGDADFRTSMQKGWEWILRQAGRDLERPSVLALEQGVASRPLSAAAAQAWQANLNELNLRWEGYLDILGRAASQDETRIDSPDSLKWLEVLHRLRQHWNRTHRTLLGLSDQPVSAEVQRTCHEVLRQWDQVFLSRVEDDRPLKRADDAAWYRLFTRLEAASDDAADYVSFAQLFRQPQVYRGQRVRIRGTARRGFRVHDRPGSPIESYLVLWVRPEGPVDSPLVVYCREMPAGFPPLPDRDQSGRMAELNEPVELDAYFFKRWLYQSESGPNRAPLLLAMRPTWEPATEQDSRLPSAMTVLTLILVIAVVSVGIAGLLFRASPRSPAEKYWPQTAGVPSGEVRTVAEQLRDLEREHQVEPPANPTPDQDGENQES